MPEYTFWLTMKRTGWTFYSLGGYSHFKVESTIDVFDGSFVKRMYTPYGGTHTNLAAKCKVLPKQSGYIEKKEDGGIWSIMYRI